MNLGNKLLLDFKNLLILLNFFANQIVGAKVSNRNGNSLDCLLKFKSITKYKNMKTFLVPGGGLGSSHPIMKA